MHTLSRLSMLSPETSLKEAVKFSERIRSLKTEGSKPKQSQRSPTNPKLQRFAKNGATDVAWERFKRI